MTAYYWKLPVSGSWTTASNWTPAGYPKFDPGVFPPVSSDTAVFATGSSSFYTVTTGGPSEQMKVIGDHIVFSNFTNQDDGYGGALLATKGALVVVNTDSSLSYIAHDGYGGGAISADASELVNYGKMAAGSSSLTNGGIIINYGRSAGMTVLSGLNISQGSAIVVLHGAKYDDVTPLSSTINGEFYVSGQGSFAEIGLRGGTGNVRALDHATIEVNTFSAGTVTFDVGKAATLSLNGSFTSANTVAFIGKSATLNLNGSSAEVISGFDKSDALLVTGTITKAVYSAGTGGHGSLALYDGATKVETLSLNGKYTGNTFKVAAAAFGETRITVDGPAAKPAMMSAAAGNTTLGGAGMGSFAALAADVHASSIIAADVGGHGSTPSVVEPTAYAAAFDLAHTLSDGSTFSFVHSSH